MQAAILAGDSTTGVCLQRMVLKLDAGPLVAESEDETIRSEDNSESLGHRLSLMGAKLVRRTLPMLLKGHQSEVAQNEKNASFCRMIRKEQGRLTGLKKMLKRLNGNYGLSPLAGIHCFGPDGKRLQLLELEVVDENSEPGYVQQGLIVGTRKGSLRILRLREEGKKEMDAHHFSMAIRITTDLYSNNG